MDRIIQWSIANRLLVVIISLGLLTYGTITALRAPVDVFPDLTAPTVTVVTEAHGLAPQEVETLVSFPIESAVNGSTGVRRVRSSSGIGISIVWVESSCASSSAPIVRCWYGCCPARGRASRSRCSAMT
jgi:Cu/Ag efflux pump CusA